MVLTDTHTHLYVEQFQPDRKEMMQRAFENGIERIFLPNIDSSSIADLIELTNNYPTHCFPMIGLHPCSVKNNFKEELLVMQKWLKKRSFCAIGEIGIDLYWDKTTLDIQKKAFIEQIEWAKEYEIPIVIHCREAFKEITSILDEVNDERLTGIFHCFTGTLDEAHQIIDYGQFKIGIGGVVTFKNSGLDKVVAEIPLEHIVLETDSPYLTPTPYRGKRNETSYLKYIAHKVAEIHQTNVERIAEITTKNSEEVFKV